MRVAVVGTSGCGKTTFSKEMAERLGVPHIELDVLHWGPSWTERPTDVFREEVSKEVAAPAWVCDGNYDVVRDLVWPRATTLVWLNYPFSLVFYRAVRRTLTRIATREELFGGNRESFQLFDPEWIPWWVIRTFRRRRREYSKLIAGPEFEHLEAVEFTKQHEASAYLGSLRDGRSP